MATLKDIALRADVPMLTAFHALNNDESVDPETRRKVQAAAAALNYSLKITQIDIAHLADVAKGTVSYALNNSDLIKPATRQKVLEAAQALGYRLNVTARNLKTSRAGIIGYSWHVADDPSRMNNLLDRFIYQVTMAAEQHHYHLLTFVQPQMNADGVYETLISTTRVDGFIISDVGYEDPRIARLLAMNAPFAAFGGMYTPEADFAYADVDGKYGIKLVMDHLMGLGHERIALMTRIPGLPYADVREESYRTCLKEAGIQLQPDWIAHTPNVLLSASAAAQQLMNSKHPPTAIVCTNDLMAFGARAYLDGVGLRIPEDVALSGYDDDPTSEFLGITSVHQPIDEIAPTLVEILLGEINEEPLPERQVVFLPSLRVRHSTAGAG
ncbi:MAG: LacI family DNA-binding transcriptional regulator [Anaerolinea sp.]|nr:LacI family DNA-binding transcriptional regulator [Anaerolinea sp.]MCC6972525.1 LacI family DNA-binding transcriptional regulator [Anaerolineae bacterium]CAG1007321.1 HTH-type transcriptional repressor CytR [Anaerolineae bacterium]